MAALKIAFEAPENFHGPRPSTSRPIDLVHLAVQTMGDKLLEIEVLQLFGRQARQIMKELSSGETLPMVAAAHRLKGAALAIGAFDVAEAARLVEADPTQPVHLASLSAAVIDAELFILKLCR
ncbi:Hpt domain-containing protein [Pararhizobium gei]|uniref:Hpt domain-containing protein n=1 Tax=Pararhizobium gei TaxID=1395951 RepID=UPI0023DC110A|nr:Hpt domain-containing protein [Rhizobium gei]